MIEWLRTKIFPEALEANGFGNDVKKFVSFEPNAKKGTDHYASDVIFGEVTLENESGQLVTESVIIKVQPGIGTSSHLVFDCDAQFYNEILFYTKIIPLFRKYDTDNILSTNFCEFIYGKATNGQKPNEDIIILKSLHEKGYKLTDERPFIGEGHVNLVLDVIGKFHALSFKCKLDDPNGFYDIVSQIKKNLSKEPGEDIKPKNFLTITTARGIDPLKDDPEYKNRLTDLCKNCENAADWIEKFILPCEPLSVIAHGDFNRNNMMFKHGDNGEPLNVVFFDFATIKYCSPTIDTSYFLTLNTSPKSKLLHWDEFLQTYYGALSSAMDGYATIPSFDDIELDFRKKGVFGYYISSFYLGSVMDSFSKEEWYEAGLESAITSVLHNGGAKATEYLAEIVKHMLDKNYIFEH